MLYEKAIDGSIEDINLINKLNSENEDLKLQISIMKITESKIETLRIPEKYTLKPHSPSDSYILFTPRTSKVYSNYNSFETLHEKCYQTSGKMTEALPDVSVSFIHYPKLFVSFFILGNPIENFKKGAEHKPEILYEFPKDNYLISDEVRKMILNCSFSPDDTPERIHLTGSASDLNSLLYGQVPQKRDGNCFTFTLRSDQPRDTVTDLPNSNKELYYIFCLRIQDLTHSSECSEYKATKIYCFVTFVPLFELHYEVLSNLLMLKRLDRMEQLISNERSLYTLGDEVITQNEVKLLESYAEIETVTSMGSIQIDIEKLDKLKFSVPDDLSMIDVPWLCAPLFSSLKFDDFFLVLCALAQEKSIIFVSQNRGLLTSCVLALQLLLRPFRWPNLMVPILPISLIDVLDAPVPLLAGMTTKSSSRENLIWIHLDDLTNQVRCKDIEPNEIKQPAASQLKRNIKQLYNTFNNSEICFNPNLDQKRASIEIAESIKDY